MRLSRAARAHQQKVLSTIEVIPRGQLQHQRLIDAGPGCEVELIKRLMGKKRGQVLGVQGIATLTPAPVSLLSC